MKKVVLAGPPRSGKSCLREGLKRVLLDMPKAPYPYVITACPDGEGAWFQEAVRNDPKAAETCKAAYKGTFTPDFARLAAAWVRDCTQPLTLIDVGGKVDDYNRLICETATHIVILAGDDHDGESWNDRMIVWRRFAKDLDLRVVAEITSDYRGAADVVRGVGLDKVLRGSVHRLERGEDITKRPMVRALAEHILRSDRGQHTTRRRQSS